MSPTSLCSRVCPWHVIGLIHPLYFSVLLFVPLQEQHDLLCVLLMIRLNAEHRALMVARRVPCLDDYLDRVNLLLWPRFKVRTQTAFLWPYLGRCTQPACHDALFWLPLSVLHPIPLALVWRFLVSFGPL
jgi:hypothetical protein